MTPLLDPFQMKIIKSVFNASSLTVSFIKHASYASFLFPGPGSKHENLLPRQEVEEHHGTGGDEGD